MVAYRGMNATIARLLLAGVAALAPAAFAQGTFPEAPEAVVVRLYRDYAWQAILAPRKEDRPFHAQAGAVLERYLTQDLAALLVADRECVRRTKEICRLDFDPLFGSQDPAAMDLVVGEADRDGIVLVRFKYPGNGQIIEIRHVVVKTARGWRIRDIIGKEGNSLRKLLGPASSGR
jgi:hypothetical protein